MGAPLRTASQAFSCLIGDSNLIEFSTVFCVAIWAFIGFKLVVRVYWVDNEVYPLVFVHQIRRDVFSCVLQCRCQSIGNVFADVEIGHPAAIARLFVVFSKIYPFAGVAISNASVGFALAKPQYCLEFFGNFMPISCKFVGIRS